ACAHELSAADRTLCVLPLCHINAQCVTVMAPLASGGSVVMPRSFSASSFWGWVLENKVTWFSVVPTIISYLMHHDGEHSGPSLKEALANVRFGRSASAALPPTLHAGFEEKFGVPIVETMGLTETSAQILSNPLPPKPNKYGSPGIAFGTEIKVINKQGNTQPTGREGELMVRGDCVMRCYYKNPEATAEALEEDGWLHTGDLARQDEDGFIFITGRLKELIIKGGENIAPREIDDALYSHPSVIEAGAVGIDDDHYGQEVVACVVINEEMAVSEQELIDFCCDKLGKVKTPKNIYFFDDLPKGPSGKVQRLKLVDQLKALNV
ncbi:MAG: AMP-binding protein, partial [Motiliproteus sp.]